MSEGLYDEDGIDGPFERRIKKAIREDAAGRPAKGERAITYSEPPGKFSPNGENFLPGHPSTISAGTWHRVTVAILRNGQSRSYGDSVTEAELLFEGGCRSSVKDCDLPFGTAPPERRVKDAVRALVGNFSDTPGPYDTKLTRIECVEKSHCHAIWRVQLVTPYCD